MLLLPSKKKKVGVLGMGEVIFVKPQRFFTKKKTLSKGEKNIISMIMLLL